jgi:carbon starvation protein
VEYQAHNAHLKVHKFVDRVLRLLMWSDTLNHFEQNRNCMKLALLGISFVTLLIISYRAYGNYVSRQLKIDDNQITPAHRQKDGIDFVPTRPLYLFSQHFSAIAAAGPIVGPIMACMMWGFLPALIWIALGVVLIGAVHDFLSLAVSVRHGAVSIAHVTKDNLGKRSGLAMMIFIWLALIYVIVAFTDITAASFVGITEELESADVWFNPGGAVALAAISYLTLSLIMGLVDRVLKPRLWISTVIFIPLVFFSVWLGTKFSTVLLLDAKTWCILILGYCFLASLSPVWLILQPRGYLGGFILFIALAIGIMGMLFGNYEIKQRAFNTWDFDGLTLFPFLFVTIACGACSGFHSLVCSGTTSKQIDKESHMQVVGYGAMLGEAMVALIALATIMIWSPEEIAGLKPGTIYGKGIGEFLTLVVGKKYLPLAITFGAMAFSTFVFDTLDVSTRLGRYILQELFGFYSKTSAVVCTFLTILIPIIFIFLSDRGSYIQFWSLFGASNQLLAALTLLSITVWLYKAGKRVVYVLLPMLFVLVITCWALGECAWRNLINNEGNSIHLINGAIALSLVVLAIFLVVSACVKIYNEMQLRTNSTSMAQD